MTSPGSGRVRLGAVVLNYGTPHDALLAVRSLQRSRRPVDDLLVVDNASQDGSAAWLAEHLAGVEVLVSPRNLGYSGGMNLGLEELRRRGAALLLALNADVVLASEALGRLAAALAADPAAGVAGPLVLARKVPDRVGSAGMTYREGSGRVRQRAHGKRGSEVDDRTERVAGVEGSAMLVRREVFERVGLFDERFFFGYEDLEFCLRAARGGFTTLLVGGARAYHEGAASLPATSPARLYYGTRNQLLLAGETSPAQGRVRRAARAGMVLVWNVAHALLSSQVAVPAGLRAVAAGARDHWRRRYGERRH